MGDVTGMLGERLEGWGFDEMGLCWEGNRLDWTGLDWAVSTMQPDSVRQDRLDGMRG